MIKKVKFIIVFLLSIFLLACSNEKAITFDDENNLNEIKPIEKSENVVDSTGEEEQNHHELKDEGNRELDTGIISDIKKEIDIEKFLSEIDSIKENLTESYPDKYFDYIRVYSHDGDIIIEPLNVVKDENGELKYMFRIGANYTDYLYYNEMRWIEIGNGILSLGLERQSIIEAVLDDEVIEEDDPRYPYILEKKERDWLSQIVSEENIAYDDLKS